MKQYTIILMTVGLCLFAGCKNVSTTTAPLVLSLDSLSMDPGQYENTLICTEGMVVHVCPVNGTKMKIQSAQKAAIKVIPDALLGHFDQSLNGKQVRITGIVTTHRVPAAYIDSIERQKIILCHIDCSPCSDSVWIAQKEAQGTAEETAKFYTGNMRHTMSNGERLSNGYYYNRRKSHHFTLSNSPGALTRNY